MSVRRSTRKRQTQLSFNPLASSSPIRQALPEAIRDRAAQVTYSVSPSPAKKTTRTATASPPKLSSQLDLSFSTQNSSPSSRRRTRSFFTRGQIEPTLKTTDKSRSSRMTSLATFDDSEGDVALPSISSSKKSTQLAFTESDSDVIPSTARSTLQRSMRNSSPINESDSDIKLLSSIRKRRKKTHIPSDEEDDNSGLQLRASSLKARKVIHIASSEEDEDEVSRETEQESNSDSNPVPLPSRRIAKTNQRQEDLIEDLDFLEDADNTAALRGTQGSPSRKIAKQRALEALKRKRSQRNVNGSSPAINTQESEDDDDSDDPDDLDDLDNLGDLPNLDVRPTNDDKEDDFIEEDDTLGAPVELPFEFSQYATMKARDLFKFAVEWMVQKKINPAFAMEDEVYQLAFRRLDDMVRGLGGSKFQSSAWVSGFLKSLRKRPVIAAYQYVNEHMQRDHCDACNRSNHPATWEVQFTGKEYDKETLEEQSSDEEESEENEGRGESNIPAESTRYYLGRFCMQNARVAHALAHWRFHLNEWAVDYLEAEEFCTPEKIVERDRWSTKKRRKYANGIVDRMEAAGEIKRLHRDFKNEIEDAQQKQQSRYDRSSP